MTTLGDEFFDRLRVLNDQARRIATSEEEILVDFRRSREAFALAHDTPTSDQRAASATQYIWGDVLAAQFVRLNGEFLSIADNPSLSTGDIDFTILMWPFLDSKANNMVIAGKFTGAGNLREFRLRYGASADRYQFRVSPDGTNVGMGTVEADNFGAVATGVYNSLFAWHDSILNTINLQVNAGLVDSVAYSSGSTDLASAFNIGADGSGTGPWDGRIGPGAFWKRVLTAAERTWLDNSGAGRQYGELGKTGDGSNLKTDLISWWPMGEKSGTRVDVHGSNDLTDNNTVTMVERPSLSPSPGEAAASDGDGGTSWPLIANLPWCVRGQSPSNWRT